MGSSAVSRSWIGRRVLSGRFFVGKAAGAFFVSRCRPHSSVERTMSTAIGSSDVSPSSPPLLMLSAAVDKSGRISYTFHSLTRNDTITYNTTDTDDIGSDDVINDVKFAGSSRGCLALYNRRNHHLLLSDPIAQRHLKLPPMAGADRVVLSSSLPHREEEDTCLAFASDVYGRLAFCSPLRRSGGWTAFGTDGRSYENLVYSRRHRRLFCVTVDPMGAHSVVVDSWGAIESWAVRESDLERENGPTLSLDRWIRCNVLTNDPFNHKEYEWPTRCYLKKQCYQIKYLVSDESSGDLFLVVRHTNPRSGRHGSFVDRNGCNYHRNPYRTVDFDVFRVDWERGKLEHMMDSLGGLALFVGINEPLAINPVCGVSTDSIYFTDENRLVEPTRLVRTNYGGHDNGVFDYRSLGLSPCCDYYPIEFDKIKKTLPLPLWFTPSTQHNIS